MDPFVGWTWGLFAPGSFFVWGSDMLGRGSVPLVRRKYPHMGYQDRDVWTAILEEMGDAFHEVWYDVKVGTPSPMPMPQSAADVRLAEGMGCKRIDCVVRTGDLMWVVEVKPYCNHAALGQVILYDDLFRAKHPEYRKVAMAIACHAVDADVVKLCSRLDIRVWESSRVLGDRGGLPGVPDG